MTRLLFKLGSVSNNFNYSIDSKDLIMMLETQGGTSFRLNINGIGNTPVVYANAAAVEIAMKDINNLIANIDLTSF